MSLTELREVLEQLTGLPVLYGLGPTKQQVTTWDFAVIRRDTTTIKQRTGVSDAYIVVICRENYIPEGAMEELAKQLHEQAGLAVPNQEINYTYERNTSTGAVAELATLSVAAPRKM